MFHDNISASVLSYVMEMLRPFSNYSVTLNAVNSFIGERSSPVDFTTLEESESSETCLPVLLSFHCFMLL